MSRLAHSCCLGAALLLLCAQAGPPVVAQPPRAPGTPPATGEQSVFRVTSTLVQVDASVTDRAGNPVTGLTPADFDVFQDGMRQEIVSVSYISTSPGTDSLEARAAPRSPRRSGPLTQEEVRRTIVLMVDDLGLSFESMAAVRDALRRFVREQLQPGDLVALCRTSGGFLQFTSDRRLLLAEVEGLRWNPRSMTAPTGLSGQEAPAVLREAFVAGTLGGIGAVVDAMRRWPGRKAVFVLTDGLTRDCGDPNILFELFRRLTDRAYRSGTLLYTIHARGLETLQPTADRRALEAGMARSDVQKSLNDLAGVGSTKRREHYSNLQSMWLLSESTGGIAFDSGNDLNWGLDRALADLRGYYLISYKPLPPAAEPDAGRVFHRINVVVKRPGLRVRARSGFLSGDGALPPADQETPLRILRDAVLSPFHSGSVRLRLSALYSEAPKQGAIVRCLLHIDPRDLTTHAGADGNGKFHLELMALAVRGLDHVAAAVARSYELPLAGELKDQILNNGLRYTLDIPVKERGGYQIRAAVRDPATGRVGSVSQYIAVPDLKRSAIVLASLILRGGPVSGQEPGDVWAGVDTHRFLPGDEIEFLSVLEKGDPKQLESRIQILRGLETVYSGPARTITVNGGKPALTGRLRLGKAFLPGDYDLRLQVWDLRAPKSKSAEQWVDFEVADAAATAP